MEIRIDINNLVKEIIQANYYDTEQIENLQHRSLVTITAENQDLVRQAMILADAEVRLLFARYVKPNTSNVSKDNQGLPIGELIYDVRISERQAQGKEIAMAEFVHSYLKNSTLRHYYSTVRLPELVQAYTLTTEDLGQSLIVLLESKNPPRYAN